MFQKSFHSKICIHCGILTRSVYKNNSLPMKYYHFEFINRNEKTYLRNVFAAVANNDSDNHFAVNMQ